MERFESAHAGIDGAGFGESVRVPALGDYGRRGVESVVSFVVEGNSFEAVLGLLDIGA